MHFHLPDPTFTASAANRAHFRLAVKLAAGFRAVQTLDFTHSSPGRPIQ
jgi:hypothetical protein